VLPEVISPFAACAEIEELASGLTMRDIIEREQAAGIQFGPVHRQFQLEAAPEKVQRMLEKGRRHPEIVAINQAITGAEQRLFPPASLRTAINTTTTETNLWDPSLWALIPALTMRAGMRYKVSFGGVFGTTGTPTIVWTARCGTNNSAPPTGTTLGRFTDSDARHRDRAALLWRVHDGRPFHRCRGLGRVGHRQRDRVPLRRSSCDRLAGRRFRRRRSDDDRRHDRAGARLLDPLGRFLRLEHAHPAVDELRVSLGG
jgi:hypothetical protein